MLLESRQLAKLKGTYTDKLPKMVNAQTGRVHTSYAQAVAVTGRLASSDPNLQNIRCAAPKGGASARPSLPRRQQHRFADYSQIELRIMAHLSEDALAARRLRPRRGPPRHRRRDLRRHAARSRPRPAARRQGHQLRPDLRHERFRPGARQLDLERSAAQAYIERYFARYPGVAKYMESTRNAAKMNGYVETVFGRRLWLPETSARQVGRRQGAERAAINAPMQGTAAPISSSWR